jgi:RHS repeat-associated protein
VSWVHQDPVTKSQRITNSGGTVVSTVDLDPFGGDTSASSNAAFQPHRYTSYERDANGADDAMQRRYNRYWGRFDQPDPYDGSYDAANPQSSNRYAYVNNDPVNFVDPSGLNMEEPDTITCTRYHYTNLATGAGFWGSWTCTSSGGGGGGGGGGGSSNHNSQGAKKPNGAACDKKLAGIFGGPGALVGSDRDPLTVGSNPQAMAQAARAGIRTDNFGYRSIGHGPAPYPQGTGSDRGGIFHIYPNADATATNAGLYAPSGGSVGAIQEHVNRRDPSRSWNVMTVTYSRGPYAGVSLDFVHVGAGSGSPNEMGSIQIGLIGGLGSIDSRNYIHTHVVTKFKGARVDPRSVFCKEFGF